MKVGDGSVGENTANDTLLGARPHELSRKTEHECGHGPRAFPSNVFGAKLREQHARAGAASCKASGPGPQELTTPA